MLRKIVKGREDYQCNGCGETIPKGSEHVRHGLIPNHKRFHLACEPPLEETKPKAKAKVTAKK